MKKVFLLPQVECHLWLVYLPLMRQIVAEFGIAEIWFTYDHNLEIVREFFAETGVPLRNIKSAGPFEWTAPCAVGALHVYRELRVRTDIREVVFLALGGDVYYALNAKRIGFALQSVKFTLLDCGDSTLDASAELEVFPQCTNDIALNDMEAYIIANACQRIVFHAVPVPPAEGALKTIGFLGGFIGSHGFSLFSKALSKAIERGFRPRSLTLCFLVRPTGERFAAHHLVDLCEQVGVRVNVYAIKEMYRRKPVEVLDLVFVSREAYLSFAEFELKPRQISLIACSPLNPEAKGHRTVNQIAGHVSCSSANSRGCWEMERVTVWAPAPSLASSPRQLPLVSVCITHYERPDFLAVAVRSIASQSYRNLEIIVSDDGSSSAKAMAFLEQLELGGGEGRDLLVIRGENSYLGAARNRAMRAARGDYILFMDDDNIARGDEIKVLVDTAVKNDADFVGSLMSVFYSSDPDPKLDGIRSVWAGLGGCHTAFMLENYFSDANGLYKKSTIEQLDGFSEDYGLGYEDWELFYRLSKRGGKMLIVPEPLYYYRVNEKESMVRSASDKTSILRVLRHVEGTGQRALSMLISGTIRQRPF